MTDQQFIRQRRGKNRLDVQQQDGQPTTFGLSLRNTLNARTTRVQKHNARRTKKTKPSCNRECIEKLTKKMLKRYLDAMLQSQGGGFGAVLDPKEETPVDKPT